MIISLATQIGLILVGMDAISEGISLGHSMGPFGPAAWAAEDLIFSLATKIGLVLMGMGAPRFTHLAKVSHWGTQWVPSSRPPG